MWQAVQSSIRTQVCVTQTKLVLLPHAAWEGGQQGSDEALATCGASPRRPQPPYMCTLLTESQRDDCTPGPTSRAEGLPALAFASLGAHGALVLLEKGSPGPIRRGGCTGHLPRTSELKGLVCQLISRDPHAVLGPGARPPLKATAGPPAPRPATPALLAHVPRAPLPHGAVPPCPWTHLQVPAIGLPKLLEPEVPLTGVEGGWRSDAGAFAGRPGRDCLHRVEILPPGSPLVDPPAGVSAQGPHHTLALAVGAL